MKYEVILKFAYKDDGPGEWDKHGMKLTMDDIKNKTYNKTYTRGYNVEATTRAVAIARAMELADTQDRFCTGNYLYIIDVKVYKSAYQG